MAEHSAAASAAGYPYQTQWALAASRIRLKKFRG